MGIEVGILEIIQGWASGRFKAAVPYLGTLITLKEARETLNASRSIGRSDAMVQKLLKRLNLEKQQDVRFYSSEHFTHVQQQCVEDQLTKNGGVAHLLDIEMGSIWLWHPDPRYSPTPANGLVPLVLRVKLGSGFQTTFLPAFARRLEQFQQFRDHMNRNAIR